MALIGSKNDVPLMSTLANVALIVFSGAAVLGTKTGTPFIRTLTVPFGYVIDVAFEFVALDRDNDSAIEPVRFPVAA